MVIKESLIYGQNTTQRIVGGVDIPRGTYVPYQVSLQYRDRSNEFHHYCGGSVLTAKHILTAAHCCLGLNPKRISVLAGVRDLRDKTGQRVQVVSYDIHEDYQELFTADIAILRLDSPLQLDGVAVAPISLSGTSKIGGGVRATLTGWGLRLPVPFPFLPSHLENINYPTTLQTMNYSTVSNRDCENSGIQLTPAEICAKGYFLRGACSGDSGGPLVIHTPNGLRQVGIVSYGLIICGVFDVPDVYTRVSAFQNWITNRIK
ncbi:chymotrypsin-2-like [Teleopsis dalmanni]|uniref:chymotrypsin-2-like n=1 Tax=Teleopsis dalmanni TaxID=139649 RepID=UPI0018CD91CF|nr:chymotrypsin-2-like [Teleopsis dalmanni]XP_037942759.1 chymotrypsin-2-like [Teleopsis dalmanni]